MTRHELLVAIETLQQVSRYEQYPEEHLRESVADLVDRLMPTREEVELKAMEMFPDVETRGFNTDEILDNIEASCFRSGFIQCFAWITKNEK